MLSRPALSFDARLQAASQQTQPIYDQCAQDTSNISHRRICLLFINQLIIKYQMIARYLVLLALAQLITCQLDETEIDDQSSQKAKLKIPNQHQLIKKAELAKKHSALLYKGVSEQYNLKIVKYADLILTPEADEDIMITVDLLWRQKDLYLLAPVQKSEAVHVIVQQLNRSNIHNDSFYTMTGFKFKAAANTSYKIVFSEAGKQEKMAIVKISQHIITPKSAAKKEAMHVTQQKLAYALSKLQNALSSTKTGQILDYKISSYVLHQSSAYTYFQAVQSLIIVLISVFQVIFVTNLLKSDTIV